MTTLILDTSHKFLVVGLVRDDQIKAFKQENLKQKQSEFLITYIQTVLKEANIDKSEIDTIVLTDGPGSYTGLRIAMTFSKVFGLTQDVKIYTINTLLSISGLRDGFVMLDARSKRVFGAYVSQGELKDEAIYKLDALNLDKIDVYGDASLMGREDNYGNIVENILSLQNRWQSIEDIDTLSPRYLT